MQRAILLCEYKTGTSHEEKCKVFTLICSWWNGETQKAVQDEYAPIHYMATSAFMSGKTELSY